MGAYLPIYTTEKIDKQTKATTTPNTNSAQMGGSLQIKLHVENSFNPSYCSLKSLKKITKPMAKAN